MKSKLHWQRIVWPFNSAEPYASWECWAYGTGSKRARIILHPGQWPAEGWSYVANFGADSDRSHSGFLKGFVALEAAKLEIERKWHILSS